MQTFFGCHCVLQHVQADGAHKFTVQGPGWHSYLQSICYSLLLYWTANQDWVAHKKHTWNSTNDPKHELLPVAFSVAHTGSTPRSYWEVEPRWSAPSESSLQHWNAKKETFGVFLKLAILKIVMTLNLLTYTHQENLRGKEIWKSVIKVWIF